MLVETRDRGALALPWRLDGWVQARHGIDDVGLVESWGATAAREAFVNASGGV